MKRCQVWKLKGDVTADIFRERVQARAALFVDEPGAVKSLWKNFKECLIEEAVEEAVEVCGETREIRGHKESWWWNEEVEALKSGICLRCGKKKVGVGEAVVKDLGTKIWEPRWKITTGQTGQQRVLSSGQIIIIKIIIIIINF